MCYTQLSIPTQGKEVTQDKGYITVIVIAIIVTEPTGSIALGSSACCC